ncbi:MAG TPA: cytochrome c biogenesis protein CcsA [Tepidisphaeraceae bacterium]
MSSTPSTTIPKALTPPTASPATPSRDAAARRAHHAQSTFKQLLAPLASLRLTVVLIVLSMILIYAGTWAQVDTGIWQVQKQYFHSLFCWIPFKTFFFRNTPAARIPGGFPMLGGYSLGLLLLLNLLAAHALRFKARWWDLLLLPALALTYTFALSIAPTGVYTLLATFLVAPLPLILVLVPLHRKRSGVILIHLGLILLLVGEGITSAFQVESQMTIEVGQTATYSQDIRTAELAIVDTSPADHDDVALIPYSMLKTGATIRHPALPVDIKVEQFFPNADILGPMQAGERKDARATAGMGVGVTLVEIPQSAATESGVDIPSAYLTLSTSQSNLGTYLVSTAAKPSRQPIFPPQEFEVNGKRYTVQLRFKRLYKPYKMELTDFRFDRYPGTSIAKDFSSFIRLIDPRHNLDRPVRIWMNNPLRYEGETFFQADWNHETERGTVLQVVSNPGWTLPYIACAVGGMGLVIHFALTLFNFLRKRTKVQTAQPVRDRKGKPETSAPLFSRPTFLFPLGATAFCAWMVLGHIRPRPQQTPFNLDAFGQIPISYEGRIQPIDSVARNSMKVLLNRESFTNDAGKTTPAIQWLIDLWAHREQAAKRDVFRIDFPELLDFLSLKPKPRNTFAAITGIGPSPYRFSLDEMTPSDSKLQEQMQKLDPENDKNDTLFQRRIREVANKRMLYHNLGSIETLHLVPPASETRVQEWKPIAEVLGQVKSEAELPPDLRQLATILDHYAKEQPTEFNAAVVSYLRSLESRLPHQLAKVRYEHFFNRFDPITNALVLYIIVFILIALSWAAWSQPFRYAAYGVLALALLLHTFGLISRIYISGRPPVTNLASSAIFIAWGAVILSLGLEFVYRNTMGSATASLLGFISLLIADRLALSGDTMKVLQAVLDTNFWLATHVIMITLGYAATFLAGVLGIAYVVASFFSRSPAASIARTKTPSAQATEVAQPSFTADLPRMIYGITCFAILFSFIGTVLGGIWADQSWGRFWGWDPKENGAVLIVLANALLLHARWAGLVKARGIACLAIFGNIVTAWSWFGVNMLNVGLHSYGFMESALMWLLIFVISQVALIVAANLALPSAPKAGPAIA